MKPLTVVLTRLSILVALVAAAVLPIWMTTPKKLPGLALGDSWILYAERSFALFGIFSFAGIVAIRGVVQGRLPSTIGKEGFEWPEDVVDTTDKAIEGLQQELQEVQVQLQLLRMYILGP